MKSINAIANKNDFDHNNVKQIIDQLGDSIKPHAMGGTLFLMGDDINTVVQAYREAYPLANQAA